MKVIVCDDEPVIRKQIQGLILQEDKEAEVKLFGSAEDVLKAPAADLIMLDIQLQSLNGIEAARELRKEGYDTPIIFISGMKDYVFDAFDVGAFWYLIKPIEEGQFQHVFERARNEILKRAATEEEPLIFATREKNYVLKRSQIFYVENEGKKVMLHTDSGVIPIYASMMEMEEKLGAGFFRSHRGFLVNMDHIATYKNDEIEMSGGEKVFLARERYRDFVESYMNHLGDT